MKKRFKRFISKVAATAMVLGIVTTGNFGALNSKAAQRDVVVQCAASQVGYLEKATNSQLDNFTANAGYGDYTKYARDLGVQNGQPWCAYFVWWVMQTSGVSSFPKSGWVPSLVNWFSSKGAYRSSGGSYIPNPGDYVFFGDDCHVGIVEYYSNGYVHTIEGNAGGDRMVTRNTFSIYSTSWMTGFGVMNYNNDTTPPKMTECKVIEQTSTGYKIQCKIEDPSGLDCVMFPTWTEYKDQDDLDKNWGSSAKSRGTINGNTVTFTVNIKDHNNEEGVYITHIYARDKYGNFGGCGGISVKIDHSAPVVSDINVTNITSEGCDVTFKATDKYSNVKLAACVAYTTAPSAANLPSEWWKQDFRYATKDGDVWKYHMNLADYSNVSGEYEMNILVYDTYDNVEDHIIHFVIPEPTVEEPEEQTELEDTENTENQEDVTDVEDTAELLEENTEAEAPVNGDEETPDETEAAETPVNDNAETPDETENTEVPVESSEDTEAPADVPSETEITETPADVPSETDAAEVPAEVNDSTEECIQDLDVVMTDVDINVDIQYEEIGSQTWVTDDHSVVDNSTSETTTINTTTNNYYTTNNTTTNNYTTINNTYVQDGNVFTAEGYPVIDNEDVIYGEEDEDELSYEVITPTDFEMSGIVAQVFGYMINQYLSNYIPSILPENATDYDTHGAQGGGGAMDAWDLDSIMNSELGVSFNTKVDGKVVKFTIKFKE